VKTTYVAVLPLILMLSSFGMWRRVFGGWVLTFRTQHLPSKRRCLCTLWLYILAGKQDSCLRNPSTLLS